MNKPTMEVSDRGVVLNKSLAWTLLVAAVGGGIWVGTQVTDAQEGIRTLETRTAEDRAEIKANARQITEIRSFTARTDQRLIAIEDGMRRVVETNSEILRELRNRGQE
jgi:uncharacterized coiled-coil protein SlyX